MQRKELLRQSPELVSFAGLYAALSQGAMTEAKVSLHTFPADVREGAGAPVQYVLLSEGLGSPHVGTVSEAKVSLHSLPVYVLTRPE